MRIIGKIKDEASARNFCDYLTAHEIRNNMEMEPDGNWVIWVHSEEQLTEGEQALADFVRNPTDRKFQGFSEKAAAVREQEAKENAKFQKRIVTGGALWQSYGPGPLTILLIVACVAVGLMAGLSGSSPVYSRLWMSNYVGVFLPEVREGQVWRLVTPIFIHLGVTHLLFNMLMLNDLGSLIEARRGTFRLLVMVLVLGVLSNLTQYLVTRNPDFGGMSGVLYGFFGYIWMRGKFDPASGMRLRPADVMMMMGWFFLCVFKIIPNVANGAHAGGLVAGMIWGASPPLVKKLLKL